MDKALERIARLEERIARLEELVRELSPAAADPASRAEASPAETPEEMPGSATGLSEPLHLRAILYAVSLIEADAERVWTRAAAGLDIEADTLEALWEEQLYACAGDLERARDRLVGRLREDFD